MNNLDCEFDASEGEVTLDRTANVLLMDPANYDDYKHGRNYRYYGGYATRSPVHLVVPGEAIGTWLWTWAEGRDRCAHRSAC